VGEDGACLGERARGGFTLSCGQVEFGRRQQRQGTLVWCGAGFRKVQCRSEVLARSGIVPGGSTQFAEQAVGGD
jgi:hypothetical protein